MKIFNSIMVTACLFVGAYDSFKGNTLGAVHMTLLAILFQMWVSGEDK